MLAETARHARAGRRAPVLAVLAALAWAEGNGMRARLLSEQALADTPGYTLAMLVDRLLATGLAPAWYRSAAASVIAGSAAADG